MTSLPEQSSSRAPLSVHAILSTDGLEPPLDVTVETNRGQHGSVEIAIVIEQSTRWRWVLRMDPAAAALLAAGMAYDAGVRFGVRDE